MLYKKIISKMSKVSAFCVVALGATLLLSGDVPLKANGLKLTLASYTRAQTAGAVYGEADVVYKGRYSEGGYALNQPVRRQRSAPSKVGDVSKGLLGGVVGGVAGVVGNVGRAASAPVRLIGDAFKKAADSEPGPQSSVRTSASQPRSSSNPVREVPSRSPNPPVRDTRSFRKTIKALNEEDRRAKDARITENLASTYSTISPPVPKRGVNNQATRNALRGLNYGEGHLNTFDESTAALVASRGMARRTDEYYKSQSRPAPSIETAPMSIWGNLDW